MKIRVAGKIQAHERPAFFILSCFARRGKKTPWNAMGMVIEDGGIQRKTIRGFEKGSCLSDVQRTSKNI